MTGLRLIFTAGLMLGVSACSTGVNGERIFGNEESMAWHHTASDQTKLNFFYSRCQSYGFVWGTPWMNQCIAEEMRSSRRSAGSRMAGALAGYSASQSTNRSFTSCTMSGNTMTCF